MIIWFPRTQGISWANCGKSFHWFGVKMKATLVPMVKGLKEQN